MKIFFNLCVLSFCFLFANVVFGQEEISFYKGSFDQMTAKASSENKCYIVFFTKEHCPPCDRMKDQTFADPEVVNLVMEKTLMYEAEMPEFDAIELAEKFEVSAYPTLLVFSPRGLKIGEMVGGQSATSLVTFLEKLN